MVDVRAAEPRFEICTSCGYVADPARVVRCPGCGQAWHGRQPEPSPAAAELTVGQIAARLDLSRAAARRLLERGYLIARKGAMPGTWLVADEELAAARASELGRDFDRVLAAARTVGAHTPAAELFCVMCGNEWTPPWCESCKSKAPPASADDPNVQRLRAQRELEARRTRS